MSGPVLRHRWEHTESMFGGLPVQRCACCYTERVRDASTKTLYLFRGGYAIGPRDRPLSADWRAFKAGVVPSCRMAPL